MTKAGSVRVALAAGLAAVPWKSLKAADWLTKTPPVRFSERCTPAERAVVRAASRTASSVECTAAVSAPCRVTVSCRSCRLWAVESVTTTKETGPNHSRV